MQHLVIVSGPSGVGKNTLIDKVREAMPEIRYLRKIATRPRRPDDRDEEADFMTIEEFEALQARMRVALPYQLRGNQYGIPVESIAGLKENAQVAAFGNFDLVEALRDAFETTTIYVRAPMDSIRARLEAREDTPQQRAKSIAAVEGHLAKFYEQQDLFDYVIDNNDLQAAADQMIGIFRKETRKQVRVYSFLIPRSGCSQQDAQEELDYEARIFSRGRVEFSPFTAFPSYREIKDGLREMFTTVRDGLTLFGPEVYCYGGTTIRFDAKRDRERDRVAFGKITVYGMRKELENVGSMIESKWTGMENQVRKDEVSA